MNESSIYLAADLLAAALAAVVAIISFREVRALGARPLALILVDSSPFVVFVLLILSQNGLPWRWPLGLRDHRSSWPAQPTTCGAAHRRPTPTRPPSGDYHRH